MSDEKKTISKVFSKQFKSLENDKDFKGKIPTDMLTIIRFDNGKCHVIWPKDKIIRLGLFEELKIVWKEEGLE